MGLQNKNIDYIEVAKFSYVDNGSMFPERVKAISRIIKCLFMSCESLAHYLKELIPQLSQRASLITHSFLFLLISRFGDFYSMFFLFSMKHLWDPATLKCCLNSRRQMYCCYNWKASLILPMLQINKSQKSWSSCLEKCWAFGENYLKDCNISRL